MRALVTGGCGFIGSHLVRHLLDLGHQVLNIDSLTYAADPSAIQDLSGNQNHRFLQADITDSSSLGDAFAGFQPDTVFHLAAETHVDRSIADPAPFLRSNIQGTCTLLDVATRYWRGRTGQPSISNPLSPHQPFRFLHVSTDEVYGHLGHNGIFHEESPIRPRSPYSATKASSDHLVHAWHVTYGLPAIISRSSNNYGPGQHREKLIPTVILSAIQGKPIPIYGDGSNIRDWLHVRDHVRALILIAELGTIGETYLIGGGTELTNLAIAKTICRIIDSRHPSPAATESLITFVTDRPGHDFRYALDTSKIRNHLGWRPQMFLESGLAETVASYLKAD